MVYKNREQVDNYMRHKEAIIFNRRLLMVIKGIKVDSYLLGEHAS